MDIEKRVKKLEVVTELLIKKAGISENEIWNAVSESDAEAAIRGETMIAIPV